MKITITIDCGHVAFDDYPQIEIASVLKDLARKIEVGAVDCGCTLRDSNGNTVGAYEVLGYDKE